VTSHKKPAASDQSPATRDQRADMLEDFETVCFQLFKPGANGDTATVFDPLEQFDPQAEKHADIARSLNAAFLIVLAGRKYPAFERAQTYLNHRRLHSNT